MEFPVETEVEKRLRALMAPHESVLELARARPLMHPFKTLVDGMYAAGHHPEVIAWVVAQHAAAAVAALKMTRFIRPEVADALAEDFVETLNRAHPGTTAIGSRQ